MFSNLGLAVILVKRKYRNRFAMATDKIIFKLNEKMITNREPTTESIIIAKKVMGRP